MEASRSLGGIGKRSPVRTSRHSLSPAELERSLNSIVLENQRINANVALYGRDIHEERGYVASKTAEVPKLSGHLCLAIPIQVLDLRLGILVQPELSDHPQSACPVRRVVMSHRYVCSNGEAPMLTNNTY
ncbi:hypothetical protein QVD17_09216 [Tagetes erecta]|uniref:Peptidase A2 domain-containing protein n=1 Tax=Tagetes erecta TaxID=13708 RepID=A0AAD8L487_TARER|nr:hypothetical protein QVD17_09216 [Tagetes erecta]